MKLDDLLTRVPPQWHSAFVKFVKTGEAKDDFLTFIDHDEGTQQAVEMAFQAQAMAVQKLAERLSARESSPDTPATKVSTTMRRALEEALELAPEDRKTALEEAASALASAADSDKRNKLLKLVGSFQQQLAGAAKS